MENQEKRYIISCSGASNTGEYADRVARLLDSKEKANMVCMAKVAIGDQNFINKLKSKQGNGIIAIDGCGIQCSRKILLKENIDNIINISITDYGIIKGQTPVVVEKIGEIAEDIINTKL